MDPALLRSGRLDRKVELPLPNEEARAKLIDRFKLSEIQARAIVEMRLRQLTGLEQDKLRAEYEEIMKLINHLKELLASKEMRMALIKEELKRSNNLNYF